MKFNELIVSEVYQETEDCVSIAFDVPAEMKKEFCFTPGQYLSLEADINGDKVRRSYSICSYKNEPLRVAIKQVEEGVFSTWANSALKPGTAIRVSEPDGNFTHSSQAQNQNQYVAFAAGSGITPVLAIIKSVLFEEPKSNFILFYGNRRTQDVIFREELEGLKNKYMNRFQIYHILSQEKTDGNLLSGRIRADKCGSYFKYFVTNPDVAKVFLCGPYEMIKTMKPALIKEGVPEDKIKYELFYNPEADHGSDAEKHNVVIDHDRTLKITLDGLTSELKSNIDMPILDIAVEAGLDLPYSCKGGVCATCKAKILEGKIEMTTNFALEPDEVKEGYALTCQSHIKSDFVHVNFDV